MRPLGGGSLVRSGPPKCRTRPGNSDLWPPTNPKSYYGVNERFLSESRVPFPKHRAATRLLLDTVAKLARSVPELTARRELEPKVDLVARGTSFQLKLTLGWRSSIGTSVSPRRSEATICPPCHHLHSVRERVELLLVPWIRSSLPSRLAANRRLEA